MNQQMKGGEEEHVQPEGVKKILEHLQDLDKGYIDAEGVMLRPSQCYYLGTDPFHILFNTNCPDSLRQRIESLMTLYMPK